MKKFTLSLLAGVAALGYASAGYAADLIVETPVEEVGVVDVSGNWDGAYIGIFGGWASGTADHTNSGFDPPDFEGADADIDGWLLGLKAGANFTVGSGLVAGIVADIAWSDISGTFEAVPVVGDSTNSINWQASLRGLVGFDGGAFMPYLTGGLAVANATHEVEFFEPDLSVDATHVGWTVGAGVEFAVADNVSLNLEYRYSDFGSQEYDHGSGFTPPEFDLTTHAITAGVNWRF
jgi:outer membrane immunogenic protein